MNPSVSSITVSVLVSHVCSVQHTQCLLRSPLYFGGCSNQWRYQQDGLVHAGTIVRTPLPCDFMTLDIACVIVNKLKYVHEHKQKYTWRYSLIHVVPIIINARGTCIKRQLATATCIYFTKILENNEGKGFLGCTHYN